MDSITQAFSGDSGSWLSKYLPVLLAGGGAAGTIGNIGANRSRNAVLQQQVDYTKALQKMTPAQIVQGITSMEQPLSKNLTNSVGNTVSGQLAERGLSEAPGIFASTLGQGLAPYQLQEQQLAQNAFYQKLGLPIQARPSPFGPFPQTTNTSQIWQALLSKFMGTGGKTAPGTPQSNISGPLDLMNIMFPSSGLTPPTGPDMGNPDFLNLIPGLAPAFTPSSTPGGVAS